jgi:hypothetical protein
MTVVTINVITTSRGHMLSKHFTPKFIIQFSLMKNREISTPVFSTARHSRRLTDLINRARCLH